MDAMEMTDSESGSSSDAPMGDFELGPDSGDAVAAASGTGGEIRV